MFAHIRIRRGQNVIIPIKILASKLVNSHCTCYITHCYNQVKKYIPSTRIPMVWYEINTHFFYIRNTIWNHNLKFLNIRQLWDSSSLGSLTYPCLPKENFKPEVVFGWITVSYIYTADRIPVLVTYYLFFTIFLIVCFHITFCLFCSLIMNDLCPSLVVP